MGFKQLCLILTLQLALSWTNGEVTTEIDLKEHLSGLTMSDTYYELASELPEALPTEIRESGVKGIWVFSESVNEPGVIIVTSKTTVSKITLKLFNTAPEGISLFFKDQAQDDTETMVPIGKTESNEWIEAVLDVKRDFVSTESISFRFQFPETEAKSGHFLLDSITIVGTAEPILSVVETKEQLSSYNGFTLSGKYLHASGELDNTVFPPELINSNSAGIWQFSETDVGALNTLALAPATTIMEVTIKYFNTKPGLQCHFTDIALDDSGVSITIPKTVGNTWTENVFEVTRDFLSTEPISFRFVFPKNAETSGHFLLDSITIKGKEVEEDAPATEAPPTTTEESVADTTTTAAPTAGDKTTTVGDKTTPPTGIETTPGDGDGGVSTTESGTSAVVPTILTVSLVMLLKVLM